ncbi:hypothetical protein ElyMa_003268000 [Elysia marginata]|uniref:Uncharacterized protein n=1 Tax=Elysia marginata TaxID=1093978 RepID=A0AAV4J8B3_9GAST|nr:hypothetical protein ElyMa_003268000 [Elysia marginata]
MVPIIAPTKLFFHLTCQPFSLTTDEGLGLQATQLAHISCYLLGNVAFGMYTQGASPKLDAGEPQVLLLYRSTVLIASSKSGFGSVLFVCTHLESRSSLVDCKKQKAERLSVNTHHCVSTAQTNQRARKGQAVLSNQSKRTKGAIPRTNQC